MADYDQLKKVMYKEWERIDGERGAWMKTAIDEAVPTRTKDIKAQWVQMPYEFCDAWQDKCGIMCMSMINDSQILAIEYPSRSDAKQESCTIEQLMLVDLYLYIEGQYVCAHREITEQKEEY